MILRKFTNLVRRVPGVSLAWILDGPSLDSIRVEQKNVLLNNRHSCVYGCLCSRISSTAYWGRGLGAEFEAHNKMVRVKSILSNNVKVEEDLNK